MTSTIGANMVSVDKWTIPTAIIALVQLGTIYFIGKEKVVQKTPKN